MGVAVGNRSLHRRRSHAQVMLRRAAPALAGKKRKERKGNKKEKSGTYDVPHAALVVLLHAPRVRDGARCDQDPDREALRPHPSLYDLWSSSARCVELHFVFVLFFVLGAVGPTSGSKAT